MARTYFHDFMETAREELGVGYREALEFYHELRDLDYSPDEMLSWVEEAEPEEAWEDEDFDDVADEWVEEWEEFEISAELDYEEAD